MTRLKDTGDRLFPAFLRLFIACVPIPPTPIKATENLSFAPLTRFVAHDGKINAPLKRADALMKFLLVVLLVVLLVIYPPFIFCKKL
jgi:hypothetical protein